MESPVPTGRKRDRATVYDYSQGMAIYETQHSQFDDRRTSLQRMRLLEIL